MLVLPFCAVPLFIVCVCVMCRMYYYAHVHVFSALFVSVCVGPSGFVRSRAIGWLVVIGRRPHPARLVGIPMRLFGVCVWMSHYAAPRLQYCCALR